MTRSGRPSTNLGAWVGLLIVITVGAFNYFGEGLRTAFNVSE